MKVKIKGVEIELTEDQIRKIYEKKRTINKSGTTPIAKVSDKKKKQDAIYSRAKKEYVKDHPLCEAGLEGCTGKVDHIHHKRGKVGKDYTDPKNFLSVCFNCHEWIERHPDLSKALGLSTSRLNKRA